MKRMIALFLVLLCLAGCGTAGLTPTETSKGTEAETADPTCTISISCATVLENMDKLPAEKADLIPADGWLLEPTEVSFAPGETVFDVLLRTAQAEKIHMEYTETPAYNSVYIEGIGNLYEFDCGNESGWQYSVNDWFPNYGCSGYELQNGDVICWVFTCDMGADVGGQEAQAS